MASKDKTRSSAARRSTPPSLRPGPNGLPRGQVTEIQRGRMLTATVEAIEEVGYARLTVAQVIGRAKVSRKTFYDVSGGSPTGARVPVRASRRCSRSCSPSPRWRGSA
jgi:hypothetical protein